MHTTPYGGAVQEPRNHACSHYLPEPTTPTTTLKPPNDAYLQIKRDCNTSSTTAGKRGNATRTTPYGGALRAHMKSAHHYHLSELTAHTCKTQILRDTKPNINLPTLSLPIDTHLPTEAHRVGNPDTEMRHQDRTGISARTGIQRNRLRTSPTRAQDSAKFREHVETHHPNGRDKWKRPITSEALESVCTPLPNR